MVTYTSTEVRLPGGANSLQGAGVRWLAGTEGPCGACTPGMIRHCSDVHALLRGAAALANPQSGLRQATVPPERSQQRQGRKRGQAAWGKGLPGHLQSAIVNHHIICGRRQGVPRNTSKGLRQETAGRTPAIARPKNKTNRSPFYPLPPPLPPVTPEIDAPFAPISCRKWTDRETHTTHHSHRRGQLRSCWLPPPRHTTPATAAGVGG